MAQINYRGMPLNSISISGTIASARDIGNIGAGIVAKNANIPFPLAEIAFSVYDIIEKRKLSKEATVSREAQRIGYYGFKN